MRPGAAERRGFSRPRLLQPRQKRMGLAPILPPHQPVHLGGVDAVEYVLRNLGVIGVQLPDEVLDEQPPGIRLPPGQSAGAAQKFQPVIVPPGDDIPLPHPVEGPYQPHAGDIPGVRFSKKDLVGEWKYINHGTKITPEIVESSLITLNGDGTVTGAVNGTWAMEKKQGHYYATFNLDGKVFKGVFHYQYDPDNNVNRLTFSACGASNETIWGSKAKVR